jgi:hypothetical protein
LISATRRALFRALDAVIVSAVSEESRIESGKFLPVTVELVIKVPFRGADRQANASKKVAIKTSIMLKDVYTYSRTTPWRISYGNKEEVNQQEESCSEEEGCSEEEVYRKEEICEEKVFFEEEGCS